MKALLNDGLDQEGIEIFTRAEIEIDKEKREPKKLVSEIGDFDALVVRSATKVTKDVLEEGSKGRLKAVGRAGVGYDNIDIKAASECGVLVKIAPHGVTNATAELSLGLMLSVARKIANADASLKSGVWKKKEFEGVEIAHKTLGVIGCGRIGQRLNELVRGFDMKVIGYDAMLEQTKARFPNSRIEYLPKDEVLRLADFVSLHTGGREVIIGERELAIMKQTAYLINVSRGNNIDEEALYSALKQGKIAGAGIDVYQDEPKKDGGSFQNKLIGLDNVVLSSHLGASSIEGQKATSIEIARVITDYLLKGDFNSAVNIREREDVVEEIPIYPLFLSHKDVPGVFARISGVLAEEGINIREIKSSAFDNTGYASTVYLTYQPIGEEVIDKLRGIENVVSVKV